MHLRWQKFIVLRGAPGMTRRSVSALCLIYSSVFRVHWSVFELAPLFDWVNPLTIFRRVRDFLMFSGFSLSDMHLANNTHCTQSVGWKAHKIVCITISYRYTSWTLRISWPVCSRWISRTLFLKKIKLYEHKNLDVTSLLW